MVASDQKQAVTGHGGQSALTGFKVVTYNPEGKSGGNPHCGPAWLAGPVKHAVDCRFRAGICPAGTVPGFILTSIPARGSRGPLDLGTGRGMSRCEPVPGTEPARQFPFGAKNFGQEQQ